MQTNFSPAQLADPAIAEVNGILRNCVHCGFCTATCPTYVLLGDELDSPRGRIYLIKDMLERDAPATAPVVKHIDRCLSCLACSTACPAGVNYMHLIDQARGHVERTYRRPWFDRTLRALIAHILPYPKRARIALAGARLLKPFAIFLPRQIAAMVRLAPAKIAAPSAADTPQVFPAHGVRRKRVALLAGCVQQALDSSINEATVRILTRHGVEVVVAKGAGCCGGLAYHMGRSDEAHGAAAANIRAWTRELEAKGLDAIVINTSGCGTTIKDYGHIFQGTDLAKDAARIAGLAKDITEVLADLGVTGVAPLPLRIAYHAPCSLQHGQQLKTHGQMLLRRAGFEVAEPADSHLCCGSAGTYNLLQPDIAGALRDRKVATIAALDADVIASGNIGCMTQIGSASGAPVVHTVELLDWATGGPKPPALV